MLRRGATTFAPASRSERKPVTARAACCAFFLLTLLALCASLAVGFLFCAGIFLFAVSPRSRFMEREAAASEMRFS